MEYRCEDCGVIFYRDRQKGRPPKYCPPCRAAKQEKWRKERGNK